MMVVCFLVKHAVVLFFRPMQLNMDNGFLSRNSFFVPFDVLQLLKTQLVCFKSILCVCVCVAFLGQIDNAYIIYIRQLIFIVFLSRCRKRMLKLKVHKKIKLPTYCTTFCLYSFTTKEQFCFCFIPSLCYPIVKKYIFPFKYLIKKILKVI